MRAIGTRLYGLIGYPVAHSVSPEMMNTAFDTCGIDAVYLPFAVEPGVLAAAIAGLKVLGAGGVNVTLPHKQAVYGLMDHLTAEARTVGAVNTIRFEEDGSLTGHNTDLYGWWQSIAPSLQGELRKACVLGTGGAARAAVAAIGLYAPDCEVTVCARDPLQVGSWSQSIGSQVAVRGVPWADRHRAIAQAELICNATPIGMWPNDTASPVEDPDCLHHGQVVQDMVYRPQRTRLLQYAQDRGATAIEGLGMLVGQGAAAFTFWLKEQAPVDAMLAAARRALSGSHR